MKQYAEIQSIQEQAERCHRSAVRLHIWTIVVAIAVTIAWIAVPFEYSTNVLLVGVAVIGALHLRTMALIKRSRRHRLRVRDWLLSR